MRIDPHTHSSYSDGTDTPAELMASAARVGLDMIGLTDHDTTIGWDEAAAAVGTTGVALLRGVEMSCSAHGFTVHLLGYLFDPADSALNAAFDAQRSTRENRGRAMVERLSDDYPITWEDVSALAPNGGPVGRPHIADALVNAGAFPDRNAAFEWALHPRGPYYIHQEALDPIEAVRMIRNAGGVPVLAHPRAAKRQRLLPEEVIIAMSEAGLFGIERDHRDHDKAGRDDVERIATLCGLRIFGSSDYHGTGKLNRLGENLTDPAVIAQVEEQGRLEVIHP